MSESIKKIVYRGEHGSYIPGQPLSTRLGSISFGTIRAAMIYASTPNDSHEKVVNPRVLKAEIEITNPIFNNETDPFIDLILIRPAIGDEKLLELAFDLEDHLLNTDNYLEIIDEHDCKDLKSLIEKCGTNILDSLYIDAYPILDSEKYVGWFSEAGFDGAIHKGCGETMDEV